MIKIHGSHICLYFLQVFGAVFMKWKTILLFVENISRGNFYARTFPEKKCEVEIAHKECYGTNNGPEMFETRTP